MLRKIYGCMLCGFLLCGGAVLPLQAEVRSAEIRWNKLDCRSLTDTLSVKMLRIYRNSLKYTVNDWYIKAKKFSAQTAPYLDLGGHTEHYIRPVSHQAFSLALALRLNVYDAGVTGVPAEDARRMAVRLTKSLAYHHKANSSEKNAWGNAWQSALWAAQTAHAAWLLWDGLSEADRANVYNMVVYEADRFLNYKIPYYKDLQGNVRYPGDTKAEENAWNSNILVAAAVMFPEHGHAAEWNRRAAELQLSAYAAPSDARLKKKVNGIRLCDFLQGSNIADDGTLVNHGRIHADYMVAIMHNSINALTYALAGRRAPQAAVYNGARVYEALTNLPFNSRTMYVRNEKGRATPTMYFPEGNDWGTGRQANYCLMDVMAACFGWDKNVKPRAREWAGARCNEMIRRMLRNTNGCFYSDTGENTFASREEFFLAQIAFAYAFLWADETGVLKLTNRATY